MSNLEAAVAPVFRELLSRRSLTSSVIAAEDVERVAFWAFKTAIVRNLATSYRKVVPKEHFHFAYKHRRPPPRVYVDVAVCPSHSGLSATQSQSVNGLVRPSDEAYVRAQLAWLYNIVLAIGPLLIRIVHLPLEGYALMPNLEEPGAARRLYPTDGERLCLNAPVFGDRHGFDFETYYRFVGIDAPA